MKSDKVPPPDDDVTGSRPGDSPSRRQDIPVAPLPVAPLPVAQHGPPEVIPARGKIIPSKKPDSRREQAGAESGSRPASSPIPPPNDPLQIARESAKSVADNTFSIRTDIDKLSKTVGDSAKYIENLSKAVGKKTPKQIFVEMIPWLGSAACFGILIVALLALWKKSSPPQRVDDEVRLKIENISEKLDKLPRQTPSTLEPKAGHDPVDFTPLMKRIDKLDEQWAQKLTDPKKDPARPPDPGYKLKANDWALILADPEVIKALKVAMPSSGTGGTVSQAEFNKAITDALSTPEAKQKIAEAAKAPPPLDKTEMAKLINGQLQKQRDDALAAQQKAEKLLATEQAKNSGATSKLDTLENQLKAVLAKLNKPEPPAPKVAEASENLDVIVVATDSKDLPIKSYTKAFAQVVAGHPRDPEKKYRLGIYWAQGGTLQTSLLLKSDKSEPFKPLESDPTNDTVEELPSLGRQLLAQFDKNTRPNLRCIVVASTVSKPPDAKSDGWNAIDPVDVILVRHGSGTTDGRAVAGWAEFCSSNHGSLTILSGADVKTASESLAKHLLRLADPKLKR